MKVNNKNRIDNFYLVELMTWIPKRDFQSVGVGIQILFGHFAMHRVGLNKIFSASARFGVGENFRITA